MLTKKIKKEKAYPSFRRADKQQGEVRVVYRARKMSVQKTS